MIDGVFSPFLTLTPGRTYRFDQSDNSNSSHPINFYLEADKTTTYSTGVTVNGTAGNSGAYTQIAVGDEDSNSASLSVYCLMVIWAMQFRLTQT